MDAELETYVDPATGATRLVARGQKKPVPAPQSTPGAEVPTYIDEATGATRLRR